MRKRVTLQTQSERRCRSLVFITSENPARRHLSASQLAYAISAMKPYEERKARERQIEALKKGGDPVDVDRYQRGAGRVAEKLAEKAGIGARTINRASASGSSAGCGVKHVARYVFGSGVQVQIPEIAVEPFRCA